MASSLNKFCGSPFWNYNLTWNTTDPVFTDCFEMTVLTWIPLFALVLFIPLDLYLTSTKKSNPIKWNWINKAKITIISFLMLATVIELLYNASASSGAPAYYWEPSLKFISLGLCLLLTIWHVRKGIRSSGLLVFYWFLVLVCNIALGKKDIDSYISGRTDFLKVLHTFTAFSAFLIFAISFKADYLPQGESKSSSCPERDCSHVSQWIFAWLDPIAYKGFKRPLTERDLWNIDAENKADTVTKTFNHYWFEKDSTFRYLSYAYSGEATVLIPILRSFIQVFIMSSLLKLFEDIVSFGSPQILRWLILFFNGNEQTWKGYLYAVLLLVSTTTQTLLSAQYLNQMNLIGLRIKTCLISAIYAKLPRLSARSRTQFNSGELANLIGVDVDKIMNVVKFINIFWSAPLEIILVFTFLGNLLGSSAITGFCLMLILIPINWFLAKRIKVMQLVQMENKDKRINLISDLLRGIKGVKLNSWESCLSSKINDFRELENRALKILALLIASSTVIWATMPFLIALVIFTTYVLSDDLNILDAEKAFTAMALINILRTPLTNIPILITTLAQAHVSLLRINKFMNLEELVDKAEHPKKFSSYSLVMEEGFFRFESDPNNLKSFLKDITLKVKRGSLVAVVGAVGSGKTALIHAFLGEMDKVLGSYSTKGRIAYVSQVAWIQNMSVRRNILFGKKYESEFYSTVIQSCALEEDIRSFNNRDATEIGENGINLSGGQKQRISIARSVYNNADIYFMDDPFSSLDVHVAKHVYESVLGPSGLLSDKTRFITTHAMSFIPDVDLVVVMKDGSIEDMGTYDEISKRSPEFQKLVEYQTLQNVWKEDEFTDVIEDEMEITPRTSRKFERYHSLSGESFHSCREGQDSFGREQGLKYLMKKELVELKMGEDKLQMGKVKWRIYKDYIKAIGIFWCLSSVFWNVAYEIMTVTTSVWLAVWSGDKNLVTPIGTENDYVLSKYLGIYAVFGFLVGICALLADGTPMMSCWKAGLNIHRTLLNSLFNAPLSFFNSTSTGRVITRFSTDVDILDNSLPRTVCHILWCSLELIGIIGVIGFASPIFLSVVPVCGILYFLLQHIYTKICRQLKRLESASRVPILSHMSETMTGIVTIKAHNEEARFLNEFHEKIDDNQRVLWLSLVFNRWLSVRLETIGNLVIFSSAICAILGRTALTSSLAGLSISYALQITQSLNGLVRAIIDFETFIVSVERINEFIHIPSERSDGGAAKPGWPDKGYIEFKDFGMCFSKNYQSTLKDITFEIAAGEKVAIIGRTGAGKSTLALSLFRIEDGSEGSIFIDGTNINNLNVRSLRSRLTIIPQDPVIFSGSVRMNLDPEDIFTDEKIWACLEKTNLKKFFRNHNNGLLFQITEGGSNLSSGQRQLICLARAILHPRKILVLDEATSALDHETDKIIQQVIRKEFSLCTVIAITHRIDSLIDFDRILVLDKGSIVEFDSPDNLLSNASSNFYQMLMESEKNCDNDN